jgi:hypothetical protein
VSNQSAQILDDLFVARLSFSSSREGEGRELSDQKLEFGLNLLEDYLLHICLPYLESDEDRTLFDEPFFQKTKALAVSIGSTIPEHQTNAAIETWNEIERHVGALGASTKPSHVLLLAIAVAVVRRSLKSLGGSPGPVTTFRSRAHPSFHKKLREVCDSLRNPLLNDRDHETELRNLKAALRAMA